MHSIYVYYCLDYHECDEFRVRSEELIAVWFNRHSRCALCSGTDECTPVQMSRGWYTGVYTWGVGSQVQRVHMIHITVHHFPFFQMRAV